jgi:hypothetical protein
MSSYRTAGAMDTPPVLVTTGNEVAGAEIKACCRLSALLDIPLVQAAQNVVPVAVTAAESVERLRTWASGRCLSAQQPGLYQHIPSKTGSRRKIPRDSSLN